MFQISICEVRGVALVRFSGRLVEDDFRRLDKLAADARASNASFDTIFDMTGVEQVDLAAQFVAARGALPQAYRDRQRLYVVPQDDLKLLVQLYVTYQANQGARPKSCALSTRRSRSSVSRRLTFRSCQLASCGQGPRLGREHRWGQGIGIPSSSSRALDTWVASR